MECSPKELRAPRPNMYVVDETRGLGAARGGVVGCAETWAGIAIRSSRLANGSLPAFGESESEAFLG